METSEVIWLVYTKKGFDRPAGFLLNANQVWKGPLELRYLSQTDLNYPLFLILRVQKRIPWRECVDISYIKPTFPTLNPFKARKYSVGDTRIRPFEVTTEIELHRGYVFSENLLGSEKPNEFFHIAPFTAIKINKMHTGYSIHIITSFSA